jgi:hypothetical protein
MLGASHLDEIGVQGVRDLVTYGPTPGEQSLGGKLASEQAISEAVRHATRAEAIVVQRFELERS